MERVLKAEEALEQLVLAIREIVTTEELDRFRVKATKILETESRDQYMRLRAVPTDY